MKYVSLFLQVLQWLADVFRQQGAQEERKRIDTANAERLERQNEVADKPVSKDGVQTSLRNGTF